ncbi:hypothetical protein E3O11_00540 [Cryobacterium levicorallinum]|uniref:AIPR protein n=1 Tax=Cryobacterium levicorallinum TaxID=995038 RepID=A0A1I2ZMJ5_9MICO|nr:AIPR family protein [Cryobacterium levicorallinum]TFB89531.1 hypothetical protein E3O11_00540 [Cryobacterium levicorallinum]GEP25869.1 hypothetical protein CLE01_04670 [Cryobacterium levicorallinum]SFH38301.1 AIPR protein [Cryobacterium levicorallinum]
MTLNATQEIVEFHFDQFHKTHFPKFTRGDAFTQFCARLALKPFKLGEDSIQSGIVDGKYDGGIDSFHIVVNKTGTVTSDTRGLSTATAPKGLQSGVPFDVIITQAKSGEVWDQDALWKLQETIGTLLDPRQSLIDLRSIPLNDAVVNQMGALRRFEKKLVSLNPIRSFHVYLMANAAEGAIHKHLQSTQKALEKSVRSLLPHNTDVQIRLIGAEGLDELIRAEADFDGLMTFSKPPIREQRGKSQAFLGLVTVKQYLDFLRRGKTNVLRDEFFSVNVRDFAGSSTGVNSAIRNTLSKDSDTAFWWMNNGITIISDSATEPTNDSWLLKNPQIVNGLQTSHVIHESDLDKVLTKKRLLETILIRIITEKDPSIRESIITGTNNQTSVGSLQLYANEPTQIRLETYLLSKGWYYERRRWQYRNTGTTVSRIRNISELAQAIMAVHLLRPDTARARPGALLGKTAGYASVFSESAPEGLYSKSLDLMEAVESYLRTENAQAISPDYSNDRFYIASGFIVRSLGLKNLENYSGWLSVNNIRTAPSIDELTEVHEVLYEAVGPVKDVKSKDSLFKGSLLKEVFFKKLVAKNNQGKMIVGDTSC